MAIRPYFVEMLIHTYQTELLEAGCDEAGRGCLAGPVVAAAVILDPNNPIEGLDDSKKISEKKRELLRPEIEAKALAWAVGIVSNVEIDEINILKGSFVAMHQMFRSCAHTHSGYCDSQSGCHAGGTFEFVPCPWGGPPCP